MKRRFGLTDFMVIACLAVVLVCGVIFIYQLFFPAPKPAVPQTELIVRDGIEYQVLAFDTIWCGKVLCRLVMFGYPSEVAAVASGKINADKLRRGTIIVPVDKLQFDRKRLGRNRIIWDRPITIEGKTYKSARWYPGHILQSDEIPQLVQERPLTRIKR